MKTPLIVAFACLCLAAPSAAMHREEIPVVMQLAHQLEESAQHVAQAAESQAHHFTWHERRMVRSLRHFAGAAARLHDSVESYFTSPTAVEEEFEHLNMDADRVESVIYRSHAVSHLVADWNRCATLLRELNRYLGSTDQHDVGNRWH